MNLRSSWVAETGQTREDTRLNQIGATTPQNPLEVQSGVLPGSYDGQYRVSGFWLEGTAAMTGTIHEGRAVVQGQGSQGVYPVALPQATTVTFAPGDALYGRIDLVVIRIYDGLYDSSNRHEALVEIVQGVPAEAPTVPATPALSLALYEVIVPAGTSAGNGGINWNTSVNDLRTAVVAVGGILPVQGEIRPGAYPGQYQDSGGSFQRWDGSAWVPYPYALGGIAPAGAVTTASYTGQYRDSTGGQLQRWSGSAWLPAVPGPYYTGSNDAGYTTSTTYTATLLDTVSSPLDITFTAPPSGAVLITYGARMSTVTTATPPTAYMGFRLTKGAASALEPDDEMAVVHTGTNNASMSSTTRVYGMTAGASYTLTAMFKVGANTTQVRAWFDNTFLRVDAQA